MDNSFLNIIVDYLYWMLRHWFITYIMLSWIIGITFIEFFYYNHRKLRHPKPGQLKKYAAISNEPIKWNRFGLYICIFSFNLVSVFLPTRVILYLTFSIICAVGTSLVLIGADRDKLISGWRKTAARLVGRFSCRCGLFCLSFLWISEIHEKIDYSKWLGDDYKKHQPKTRPPIIISNHQSWSVCVYLIIRIYLWWWQHLTFLHL